ncbi:MAG: pyridine nucleotide-disulfide oxidoreductase [Pseudonocardiaceae bacterium]|nr:pyridine nucleotide-disulfide oxidoreductase [Pseudonocardiaceae bacterium]
MAQRLVVIGGGAAGMSAASAARRVDPEREIVVLEATGHAAYGLCGIPYYLAGLVERAEALYSYPPSYFRQRRRIDLRLHAEAVELDPERRELRYREGGQDRRLAYGDLVVAAGGAPVQPALPGVTDARVVTVRTLEDAVALRALLDEGRLRTAVVVGAGYVGLEMAEALHARGVRMTVVEAAAQVMPNLDEPVAALVADEVRRHGVDLRLGVPFEGVRRDGDALVALVDGAALPADLVVLAMGVRPAADVATLAGARTGPAGALLVDEEMCTTLPSVYAAGDCIAPQHLVLGRPAYLPLGPAGNKTGRVAGTVVAGGTARFRGVVGTAVVKVFNLAVARTGLTLTEARQALGAEPVATDAVGRSCAKYYPGSEPVTVRLVHEPGGRLLGAQFVSRGEVAKRVDVVATALQAGFDVADLLHLDLSYAPPYAPVYEPVLLAAQAAIAPSAVPA